LNRILLLGGTTEALRLAYQLPANAIYSLAGLGQVPDDLPCHCHVGGFGGIDGLTHFLGEQQVDLLLDLTHPYAEQISRHAHEAARQMGIPYWVLRRPLWHPSADDDWHDWREWPDMMAQLASFTRVLMALGREPLNHLDEIPGHQHWWVRCLSSEQMHPNVSLLSARGPFRLEDEYTLLKEQKIEVIVCKNSGSAATEAKLIAARELNIPVLMRTRPALPQADRIFTSVDTLVKALGLR
jgi:precorrin-6A/cobalt-precorrin-6A reductase